MFEHRALSRQLKRGLGLEGEADWQTLQAQLRAAAETHPALASLAERLPAFVGMVAQSYQEYERDLNLRARSLELSSQELMAANDKLRDQAQQALVESENKYLRLIANLPGCVYRLLPDEHKTVVFLSEGIEGLTGYKSELFLSGSVRLSDVVVPEDWIELENRVRQSLVDRRSYELHYRIRHADGHIVWAHGRGQGLWDEFGRLQYFDGLILDNTEANLLTEQLRTAKEHVERASRTKSEFLANMSHEIRTPMNGIIGMTELALATNLTAAQREYLELVKTSADSLLVIVNDILDVSKMEAGKLVMNEEPFSLKREIDSAVQTLALRAREKGLALTVEVDADVPHAVVADPIRLRQIVINLVGNAVKFTERGEVAVHLQRVAQAGGRDTLRLSVRDTGIGISPEQQHQIFEAFTQADTSTTRRFGGTGLGLTICAGLARMMGGRIWVDSVLGQGSTFHVEFDVSATAAVQVQEPVGALKGLGASAGSSTPRWRVLLAEDNLVNQKLAVSLLGHLGHEVDVVADGQAAVAQALSGRYDLILMDMQMPHMSGIDATRAIRQQEKGQGRRLPIIAMTANAMAGDRERCLQAGMAGYISKPILVDQMLAEMERVLTAAAREAQTLPDFDRSEALERCGGDAGLLAELSKVFLADCPQRIAELEKALQARDGRQLVAVAHHISGSTGSLSAKAAHQISRELAEAGKTAQWDRAVSLFDSLRQRIGLLEGQLRQAAS